MLEWWAASWRVRVATLLVLTAVAGLAAVAAAPEDGKVIGFWPVGAAAGALLWSSRRTAPRLLPLVAVLAVATVVAGGRPADVAVGYAATIVVEVWLVWWLLSRGRAHTWRLRDDADLRRWLGAGLVGGGVGALGGAVTSAVTGFGDPGFVAVALGTAHLASHLVLAPLWAELPTQADIAGPAEHLLQWSAILVAAPAVFLVDALPPLAFTLIPLLAWSALRLGSREALGQMILLLAFAVLLTTQGHGPFAAAPDLYGLSRDVRGILLAAYTATCVLIVVPLLLRVGESVEAAREARAERDTLDRIVGGTTGVAIIGADALSRVTLFNPGAERMLGYRAEEVMGRSARVFHSPAALRAKAEELGTEATFEAVAGELMRQGSAAVDMVFTRADGVDRTHSMTLSRLTDEQGRLVGYLSTSEDVTERVQSEEALRAALDQMKEVDAVKDAFVSSVSHELRTPLTSIHGYLELLLEEEFGPVSPEQREALGRVAGNSERLLALIDDLLTLSRLQEDGLNLAPRVVDLRRVVSDACAVLAPGVERGHLTLTLELPQEPMPFLGDRDMLERVVINLVGNAVKFTLPGGRVEVGVGPHAVDGSIISVRDTGIGIPLSEQHHLFDRFFRSSLAQKHAIPGSGLGLSIARAVVAKHGGELHVQSAEGEGTTFRIHLPGLV